MRRNPTALREAICAAALLAAGAGVWASSAAAATFTVTNTSNAGTGSLRQAMIDANNSDGDDVIVFSGLAPGSTISAPAALPDLTGGLTIDASGAPGLVLQGFDPSITAANFLITNADLTLRGVGLVDGGLSAASGTTLILDAAGSPVTFGGVIRGAPTLVRKTGPGILTFTGATSFDGGSTVNVEVAEGTLRVDGVLAGSGVRVAAGATLAGAMGAGSAVVGAPLTVLGRVAPSTQTGLLRLGSGLSTSFASGSVLEVDVTTDDSDELRTTGPVTVASGSRLEIRPASDVFASGTTTPQTVLSASSITGTFSFPDFAFLDETVVQGATSITVDLQPNGGSLSGVAVTPNQQAVAGVLEGLEGGASGDLANVFTALGQSTTAELPGVLDAIGGETLTAFATARQILGERTARALHRRIRDVAWEEAEPVWAASLEAPLPGLAGGPGVQPLGFRALAPVAAPRDPLAPEPAPSGVVRGGAWLDAYGLFGSLDGGVGEADLDTTLYGGTFGMDAWIADHFVVGVAAGYARADVDAKGRSADTVADVVQGALYAGYAHPRGYLSAYGRYAYAFQDSARQIASSTLSRTARASWNAQDYGAGAEAGVTLLRVGPVAFQPLAGVDWLRLTEESYRETGAGSLSLDVRPADLTSTTARFGGRVVAHFTMNEQSEFVPELRAFWQTELGDRDRVLHANLLGSGAAGAIPVTGAGLPGSAFVLGLGWSADVSSALQILADYDALLGSDRVEHQGTVAVRVRF